MLGCIPKPRTFRVYILFPFSSSVYIKCMAANGEETKVEKVSVSLCAWETGSRAN
jgi:hypothetical protein